MEAKRFIIATVIALCTALSPLGSAQAACSLGGASIAFGTYDPLSLQPLDTIGSLVFRCTQRDHNIMILLSRGGGSSYSLRRMANDNEQLLYNLYRDAGRTVIWGDGSGGTQAYFINNPQPNNQDLSVPIFGRIPANQNIAVGNYADTITVTLTF